MTPARQPEDAMQEWLTRLQPKTGERVAIPLTAEPPRAEGKRCPRPTQQNC